MKYLKCWIISLCIILGIPTTNSVIQADWISNLIKYIQNDSKANQLLIFFDHRKEFPIVEDVVQRISKYIPSQGINFQEVTKRKRLDCSQFPSLRNPRTTIIIIFHLSKVSGNTTQLNRVVEFIDQLSGARTRPKCLIFVSLERNSFSFKKLLRHMWAKRYLDVTILELLETTTKKNHFLDTTEDPIINQFNPFKNTYDRFKYSKSVSWFPDKIRNLQGLEMKVGLVHIPPFVFLEHNSRGDIVKMTGEGVSLTKELANAMNFRIAWNASNNVFAWGSSINCTKESSTGFIYKLMINELDFIGFENGRYDACYEYLYEHSRGTTLARITIVVPTFLNKSDLKLDKWQILNALAVVIMFVITWIISHLLLHETESLDLLQITRIVLGTTTTKEPNKLAERIVFGSMLFSCLLHGTFIYTTFTKLSLETNTGLELKTVNDVVSSDLLPVIGKDYYRAFYEYTEGDTRLLLEKSNLEMKTEDCLVQLLRKKNVACIMRSELAEIMIESNRDNDGRPVMKVLNEVLRSTVTGMNMEAGSPYVRRFDEIIERLIESGVVGKWQQSRFNRSSFVTNTDESYSQTVFKAIFLRRQIIYLFIVGYTCATVAFFGEILFAYFKN